LAAELGVEHSIVILPFLQRDVLAAVYRRATLLLHTAEAEGFGLPLVEAMACGCAVVVSDVPVLREVGAAAATYCGLADMDAWKKTVIGLLHEKAQDHVAWNLRHQRALAHASRFSWAENARQTASVYRKILEND
jgi:glycosyltransferase involved in cell wall biosynthesis